MDDRFGRYFVGSAASDVHLLCSERIGSGGAAGASYRRVEVGDAAGVARALDELVLETLALPAPALR